MYRGSPSRQRYRVARTQPGCCTTSMMCCSYQSLKPCSTARSMSVVTTQIRSLSTGPPADDNNVILLQAMDATSSDPDLSSARAIRPGRGFAKFAAGDEFAHRRTRTVTEADCVLFATQTMAWDAVAASPLAASPYLTLAIAV